jgi:regulator of sirC expression with transglutaminase-like and TPR domain
VNPVPAAKYTMFDSDLNQDVHSSSQESRPSVNSSSTTAELAQRISDLEARLDKRPSDDEERMRHLASLIAEDIIGLNPHIRYISNLT